MSETKQAMPRLRAADLNSAKLKTTPTLIAVFQVLRMFSALSLLSIIVFIIVSFIVAIIFLVELNRTKNLYEGLQPMNEAADTVCIAIQ